MRSRRASNRITNSLSLLARSLAVYRRTFGPARALRFWRVGGASLVAAGALGLGVQLTVPPTSAIAAQLSGTISLSDLGDTVPGVRFNGIGDGDHSGQSVSGVGDVNGDGLADLLIGADRAAFGGSGRGESYLIYGQPSGSPLSGSLNLDAVGGDVAGAIFGGISDGDHSGHSVSGAGDVNGDGLDDLLIGAYRTNAADHWGESYLVYGQPSGSPLSGVLQLANVGAVVAGATFSGVIDDANSRHAVSGAGDVNGDGLADFISGARVADTDGNDRGQSYLVYGQPTGSPLSGWQTMGDVGDTLAGATFDGIDDDDQAGFSVSGAGDVNGDGLADLLIGAILADAGGVSRGETYLVYGQPTGSPLSGSLDLADVGNAVAGATFRGMENHDLSGTSVSAAGDVNGDGLDDLLIGVHRANAGGYNRGQSYLVYGQPTDSQLSGTLSLADVGGTLAGALFSGTEDNDFSGHSVSAAGDVNGDGWDDLLIGANKADGGGSTRGQTYLVYGQSNINPLSGSLSLADVGDTLAGAILSGIEDGDKSGNSVSAAGDVNGDGLDDILIGASFASADGSIKQQGESYLVYGQRGNQIRWIGPGSGNWDDLFNWSSPTGPMPQDHVFIDPANGLTVSGPASTTQMKSLVLGVYQAGTVNLLVDPAGDLLIEQTLTIADGGRLAGSGTVTAAGGITNQAEIDLGSQGLNLAGGPLTNTGLVRGSGTIDNQLLNSVGGEVRVAAGEQMRLSGSGWQSNAGRMDIVGNATQAAEIEFNGELNNEVSTGNITARNAIMRFNNGLTNRGSVGISFGTSDVYGDVNNKIGAIMTVTGNSDVTFWDDLINGGTVQVSTGSTAVYFGAVAASGDFTGGGTNFFEADLAPGSSPGKVNFGGDVVFGALARLESELQGTTAGSTYDQLDIAGSVNLDGTLDLVPQMPYTDPVARGTSDDFLIITAAARSGNFNTVRYDGSPLAAGSGLLAGGSFRSHQGGGLFRNVTYTATTVQLQNLLALAGDTDGDADVDLSDYNTLTSHFDPVGVLGPHSWLVGNFDGDGDVDLSDYNWLATNFSPAGYGSAAVPEPSTAALAVTALMLVGLSGRPSV